MRELRRCDASPNIPASTTFGCLRIAAMVAAALMPSTAYADDPILPHYQIQLSAWGPDTPNQNKTDFSDTAPVSGAVGFPQGYVSAFTRNDNGGLAQANFHLTSSGTGNDNLMAFASFDYQLRIVPLTASAPADAIVPIHIVAHGAANVTASNSGDPVNAGVSFYVGQSSALVDTYAVDTDGLDGAGSGFAVDQEVSASVASPLYVLLQASTGIISSGRDVAAGLAYVDPIFTIDDPHWASLYKIVGVPGDATPPTSSVPEPAAWTMMIAGFGAVGMTMRRRARLSAGHEISLC